MGIVWALCPQVRGSIYGQNKEKSVVHRLNALQMGSNEFIICSRRDISITSNCPAHYN